MLDLQLSLLTLVKARQRQEAEKYFQTALTLGLKKARGDFRDSNVVGIAGIGKRILGDAAADRIIAVCVKAIADEAWEAV
ncbi:MAG: hypothetical protein HYV67_01730 [Candidatus Taylorbacteria bacterium]|nr:hypothetical protein [Candidatus Taylorbacteria bacterium]